MHIDEYKKNSQPESSLIIARKLIMDLSLSYQFQKASFLLIVSQNL